MADPRRGGAPYTPDPRPPAKDTTYERQQEHLSLGKGDSVSKPKTAKYRRQQAYLQRKLESGGRQVKVVVDSQAFQHGYNAFEPGLSLTVILNSNSTVDHRGVVMGWYKAYNEWLRRTGQLNMGEAE
jgi:hypothetical protein